MLKDLTFIEPKRGEPYHRATLVASLAGLPVFIKGWRYFADGRVEPPKAKWGGAWADVVPPDRGVLSVVKEAFSNALKSPTERAFDEAQRCFDLDPLAAKRAYPSLYRACFLARNTEWASEFGALPQGRLWPDKMLRAVAKSVEEGNTPHEELLEDIQAGVLSKDDARKVQEFLGKGE